MYACYNISKPGYYAVIKNPTDDILEFMLYKKYSVNTVFANTGHVSSLMNEYDLIMQKMISTNAVTTQEQKQTEENQSDANSLGIIVSLSIILIFGLYVWDIYKQSMKKRRVQELIWEHCSSITTDFDGQKPNEKAFSLVKYYVNPIYQFEEQKIEGLKNNNILMEPVFEEFEVKNRKYNISRKNLKTYQGNLKKTKDAIWYDRYYDDNNNHWYDS